MASVISKHKRAMVYKKTGYRCAICGKTDYLTVDHFIPTWTRVVSNYEPNLIPLCMKHNEEKDCHFITLSQLHYLPDYQIKRLMLFYNDIRKYLGKYVREYGSMRTCGILNVESSLEIIKSYDEWLLENGFELK